MLYDRVVQTRLSAKVQRCHVIPHHGSYSVAEHSWGVAMLMLLLWPEDFPRLAGACLCHDVPEGWLGDAPGNVKGDEDIELETTILEQLGLPGTAALTQQDRDKLRACDNLELYVWCKEQLAGGNTCVAECKEEIEDRHERRPFPAPANWLLAALENGSVRPRSNSFLRDIKELLRQRKKEFGLT